MVVFNIAGNYQSALTHFALYGVVSIAEMLYPGHVTFRWTNEAKPRAVVKVDVEDDDKVQELIAQTFIDIARNLSRSGSWVKVQQKYGKGKKEASFSPFSPRIRVIQTDDGNLEWLQHQRHRHEVLDMTLKEGDILSLRWISSLGEASYWHFDGKENRPDKGASRWEMKTRNRGEEFVQHRIRPMCAELSTWNIKDIISGITGAKIQDTLGNNSQTSRTATGFTPPGPTDVALAFAALLGISCFPTIHKLDQQSVTPGAWPQSSSHPSRMVLPINTESVTLARLRTILRSHAFAVVVEQVANDGQRSGSSQKAAVKLDFVGASAWLSAHKVRAMVVFPISLAGSASAPERQVRSGRAVPL